jgi:hypothetical protein
MIVNMRNRPGSNHICDSHRIDCITPNKAFKVTEPLAMLFNSYLMHANAPVVMPPGGAIFDHLSGLIDLPRLTSRPA